MEISATTTAPIETGADTIVVGLVEGEGVPHDIEDGALTALLDRGEAKATRNHLAVAHGSGARWILVGLGARDALDPETARVAAAKALGRARELGTSSLCWEVPHKVDDDVVVGLVEGTVLASYRFASFKTSDEGGSGISRLILSDHGDRGQPVARAAVVARAVNAARDLQNSPANHMTPTLLAQHARDLGQEIAGLSVEVEGREELISRGMGAFGAVAQGSDEEPQLIVMRYADPDASGPRLGLVGKAVTFDTGGISLKPAGKMHEMKFDMSGGAAVIEAMGAIARLRLPVDVIGVVGATENMPSGRSMKPGDVVTAMNGTTIEINNTDAEGRLVLADCLTHAVNEGAERLVDVATLTGAIVTALGSTYAGVMSNDDDWAAAVAGAGERAGEPVWRLPLHQEYADLIKGQYADITNAVENRKAGSITAAEFLARFVGDVPWAHIDIAGTSWNTGRSYGAKGGNGMGVRLLVEVARAHAGED
ncbi:leucyl aminopeptidase [Paraconexibacter sp.]|uniref:leucyl aminopeptidase n=1 Tax=Paraconexibacter sp. TaxID=2949640 RepID=UPI003565861F